MIDQYTDYVWDAWSLVEDAAEEYAYGGLSEERAEIENAIGIVGQALKSGFSTSIWWKPLSQDDAETVLFKAIKNIAFGNPTDDKMILKKLQQQGVWLATAPNNNKCQSTGEQMKDPGLTHPGECNICGHDLEHVRPGKVQCPKCG